MATNAGLPNMPANVGLEMTTNVGLDSVFLDCYVSKISIFSHFPRNCPSFLFLPMFYFLVFLCFATFSQNREHFPKSCFFVMSWFFNFSAPPIFYHCPAFLFSRISCFFCRFLGTLDFYQCPFFSWICVFVHISGYPRIFPNFHGRSGGL